ncbi:TRAP transporter large permease subunit [Cognatilysobacter terrigena]|uniref:TRAP transporter large permease subunit n=1 Tax=Cognatilysobacter terrigena TaxID=2488749 RepID=UPI001061493F|nr:TRAP transporter large permease subunit [Lysobacter terrigena]
MTTTQLIGLCLLIGSMLLAASVIARARRGLDGDTLVHIERAGQSPLVATLPVLLLGAALFALMQMARPEHRAPIVAATPVLLVLGSVLTAQRGYRRMRDAGVPQAFLRAWRRAQVGSMLMFVAACGLMFWPYVRALTLSAR